MDRAEIWLHLTSGGAFAARRSATITSTPSHARSIASVRPTGPAPTISTCVSGMRRSRSIDSCNLGVVDDLGPARNLRLDPGSVFFGRIGDRLIADSCQPFLDVRQRDNPHDFTMP